MRGLKFIVKDLKGSTSTGVRQVGIQWNGKFLARLFRASSNCEHTDLRALPSQLPFWILDNWGRIFREPEQAGEVTAEWRLAHEVSSIGGGYAWRPIRIWGEGDQVGIRTRPQFLDSCAPVIFVAEHLCWTASADVERSFDGFLEHVRGLAIDECDTLSDLYRQVMAERADPEVALWRTLEAELGFDVNEAPAKVMNQLNELIGKFGREAVYEACMSYQGSGVIYALQEGLWAVETSRTIVDLSMAMAVARSPADDDTELDPCARATAPAWALAEETADMVREKLSVPSGPITNRRLRDLLGISTYDFSDIPSLTCVPYGIRQRDSDSPTCPVALTAGRTEARRFQLCRVLGDAVWSANDRLGLISPAKSVRQEFQQWLAQSFLCPFQDLVDCSGTDSPTSEDVTAAAQRFRVSARLVQSTLVNHGVVDRRQYE